MTTPAAVRSRLLLRSAAVLVLAAGAAASPHAPACAAPPETRRLLVIGVDGYAADRAERLMAEGRLPHLAAMKERGGYARLRPSNPAQSPVSWASITTGWNPGKTGIYDFLRRRGMDPTQIDIALAEAAPGGQPTIPLPLRAVLVGIAGVLGAVAAGAVAFTVGARAPSWRRGRPFEIALTAGAATFSCGAFVVLGWVPETVPKPVNLRSGEPFWVKLDRAGVRTVTLEGPLGFPAEDLHAGCCIAGLGVPDMTGSWGSFSLWSDDLTLAAETETAGRSYYVPADASSFDVSVFGPPDARRGADDVRASRQEADREKRLREMSLDWSRRQRRESETREALLRNRVKLSDRIAVEIRRGQDAVVRTSDGATATLSPGVWSELLPVTFTVSPVVQLRGRVRLFLEDAGAPAPESRPFRLFVGQVQWDAAHVPPNVALSSPRTFAPELARDIGPFETIGWPEMTNPVKDGWLGDRAFLAHTKILMKQREKRLADRIAKGNWDVLFAMFSEPDRVQHALYRHVDPECPTHDPKTAPEFAGAIDAVYEDIDRIVGEATAAAGPGTDVLVISDHGFAPFRRGVNLNNLLRARGWQAGEGGRGDVGVQDLGGEFFEGVDWARTRAYAMGLGNVYLNLQGREPFGTVPPTEAEATLEALAREIESLRDTDGKRVVRRVYRGKDLYRGARSGEAPDLVVGFEWGYRVSWRNSLGALDRDVITPNTQNWSGDHCSVDPELVPAVVFSSLPLAPGAVPAVEDIAPSILGLFGVPADDPDGTSILAR